MGRSIITKKDIEAYGGKPAPKSGEIASRSNLEELDIDATVVESEFPQKVTMSQTRFAAGGSPILDDGEGKIPDSYQKRLVKYIPSEVLAFYVTAGALIRGRNDIPQIIHWLIFIFCIICVALYLKRISKVKTWSQIVVSMIAFFVWVFAFGGPFSFLSWYNPVYGGIVLPAYTLIVPLLSESIH